MKGDRDANIMFSPCDGCDGYRILLGGWDNYQSFIREEGLESDEETTLVVVSFITYHFVYKPPYLELEQTPGILSTEEFRRFHIFVGISGGVFKIEVRNENEEIVIERTWEESSIPWSWPVPFVAFSGFTQNPMLFKFRSCKGKGFDEG